MDSTTWPGRGVKLNDWHTHMHCTLTATLMERGIMECVLALLEPLKAKGAGAEELKHVHQ